MRLTGRVQVSCSYNGVCLADLTATGGLASQAAVQTGPTIALVTSATLSKVVSVRQASRQPAQVRAFHVWRPCQVGAPETRCMVAAPLSFTCLDGARAFLQGSKSPRLRLLSLCQRHVAWQHGPAPFMLLSDP